MQTPVLEYWYIALNEPVGIVVMSDNRHLLMNKLYAARQQAQDPDLQALSICMSPTNDTELWIVHKTVKILKEVPDGEKV